MQTNPPQQKSLTEALSPLYRKLSRPVAPALPTLNNQYTNITNALDSLEAILNQRMSVHERELLSIMRVQIERMLADVRAIVGEYGRCIREKNLSQDLWETRNQLEYFKFEALRLFEENTELRRQIADLGRQMEQLTFQDECQNQALKKLAKKLVRAKVENTSNSSAVDVLGVKSEVRVSYRRHTEMRRQSRPEKYQSEQTLKKVPKYYNKSLVEYQRPQLASPSIRKRIKTEVEDLSILSDYAKREGFSERLTLLNNPNRTERLQLLKDRMKIGAKLAKKLKPLENVQDLSVQIND